MVIRVRSRVYVDMGKLMSGKPIETLGPNGNKISMMFAPGARLEAIIESIENGMAHLEIRADGFRGIYVDSPLDYVTEK